SRSGSVVARVVIAGAGPVGAALAYLLARRGTQVTLLERHTDFAREFRGEALMPSGIDAFAQMGLGAALDRVPQTRPELLEVYRGSRRLLRLDVRALAGDDALPRFVSQPGMLEMLAAEGARCPGFHLERGATVRDLVRDGERVAGVRIETPAGAREIRGDLVI